jgi:hypothetical protein
MLPNQSFQSSVINCNVCLVTQLISWLNDNWPISTVTSIENNPDTSSSGFLSITDVAAMSLECRTVLLHLDHMRNRVSYVKTLTCWAKELHVTGRLVFFDRLINIVFQGTDKNIKVYHHLACF